MPDTFVLAAVEGVLSKEGSLEDIRQAISSGGDVNELQGNLTPLLCAVQESRADIVQCLLESKADPDLPDPKGVGPLHMAIFHGMDDVVQALVDARADVNKQDRHGQTPLFFAPHRKACALLGLAKADVNIVNVKGQTALHLASHAGLNDSVMWLVENMTTATINLQDRHGRTAVYCAAKNNLKSTILLLQEHGADLAIRPHYYSKAKQKSRQRLEASMSTTKDSLNEVMLDTLCVKEAWGEGQTPLAAKKPAELDEEKALLLSQVSTEEFKVISPKRSTSELKHLQEESAGPDDDVLNVLQSTLQDETGPKPVIHLVPFSSYYNAYMRPSTAGTESLYSQFTSRPTTTPAAASAEPLFPPEPPAGVAVAAEATIQAESTALPAAEASATEEKQVAASMETATLAALAASEATAVAASLPAGEATAPAESAAAPALASKAETKPAAEATAPTESAAPPAEAAAAAASGATEDKAIAARSEPTTLPVEKVAAPTESAAPPAPATAATPAAKAEAAKPPAADATVQAESAAPPAAPAVAAAEAPTPTESAAPPAEKAAAPAASEAAAAPAAEANAQPESAAPPDVSTTEDKNIGARTEAATPASSEAVEFTFQDLSLDKVDQTAFKKEFLGSLGKLGAPPEVLGQLDVQLRAGSIIVAVRGSVSVMQDLNKLPLDGNVAVMGSTAKVERIASASAGETAGAQAESAAAPATEAAKADAEDEEYWKKKEEEGAVMIQTVFRGKQTRRRVEKKAAAKPIPKEVVNGATVWDVVLTKKDPKKQKYGFSHTNAKTDLLKEYVKGHGTGESNISIAPLPDGPEALIVKKVGEKGLLEEWNFVQEDAKVVTGDRIFQVNDKVTIQEMQRELRKPQITMKVLRQPENFTIDIEKRPGARKLGFKFEKPANDRLLELKITEVTKDGLLDEVNRRRMAEGKHHLIVLVGMRIEQANDVSGDGTKIAEELRRCEKVTLKIRRGAAAAAGKMKVQQQLKFLSAFGGGKKSPFGK